MKRGRGFASRFVHGPRCRRCVRAAGPTPLAPLQNIILPRKRSGTIFDPYRQILGNLALVGHLGFLVAGGAVVGFGAGYGVDLLAGGRAGRTVGIMLGLASGIWAAGRQLMRVIKEQQGDKDP